MPIKIVVHVHPDEATCKRLDRIEAALARLTEHQEALVTTAAQLLALVQVVDERTNEIGSALGRVATTNSAIAESQGKLALALAEISLDLTRLRDSMGGEGGLKPGEADAVRTALEALSSKVDPLSQQATLNADALSQQQVALEAQASLATELGKDPEVLIPPDPTPPVEEQPVNPTPEPPAEPAST